MANLPDVFATYRRELADVASDSPFIVFLCGPALKSADPSAMLRRRIKDELEAANFEVVLGEDDGLDNAEIHRIGINAQDNELEFIHSHCGAIVIVAASAGSFCELALFSWHFVHDRGVIDARKTDCVVLIEDKYEKDRSYLNSGPVAAVSAYGRVEFVDFALYNPAALVDRLRLRRGVSTVDNKRGRPRRGRNK